MTPLLYLQQYGSHFEVRVTTTVAINAWQGRIILPEDLEIAEIAYGSGIGDVWQTPPTRIDSTYPGNAIDFIGGATGGFSGDGLLFEFTALPPSSPEQLISFDPVRTKIYGGEQGMPIPSALQPLTVNPEDLGSDAFAQVPIDVVPPEPFQISIIKDKEIFDGQPAAIFFATDKQSGIDHYEIEERFEHGVIGWHRAESPYLVHPEMTMMLVRAVDRSGNHRIVSVDVQEQGIGAIWLAAALILCALAASVVYFKVFRR